jgi:hypothetical protein
MQVSEGIDELSGSGLLDHVGLLGRQRHEAEVGILRAAVQFAYLHNPDTLDPEVSRLNGRERARRFGGHGTPEVAEFCAAEFGARLGVSSYAGRAWMADGLDLEYRFPLLWARVEAHEVKVSCARYVTQQCRDLTLEQAMYVDTRVAEHADGRITWTRFEQVVAAAIVAADPVAAREREEAAAKAQYARATRSDDHGMRGFYIRGPFGTIAKFDAMVTFLAQVLADLGDADLLDGRRVKAVLLMASPGQLVQLLTGYAAWKDRSADPEGHIEETHPARDGEAPVIDWAACLPAVVLFAHMYAERDSDGLARVEGATPLTEEWVRDHLSASARVTVKPVLDLAGQAPVDAYEVPERHRSAVHLMTPADTFPHSSAVGGLSPGGPRLQIDHTVAFRHGAPAGAGQSRIGNYGPMTLGHHRLKTHGRWQVQQPFPGIYVWRDPHGVFYLVDHTGTRRIDTPHIGAPSPQNRSTQSQPMSVIEFYEADIQLDWAA